MSELNSTEPKKYFRINFRVSEYEYQQFQMAKELGLSARDVLELINGSCCGNIDVVITKKSNLKQIVLKRGLFHRNQTKLSKDYLYQ